MNTSELWQTALGELELNLSRANFTTWFRNTSVSSFENGRIIINVPNAFTKTWLEKKYHTAIIHALQTVTNEPIKEVVCQIGPVINLPYQTVNTRPPAQNEINPVIVHYQNNQTKNVNGLNPRYTFDTFIVGKGSELAHAAAKAVVDNPGRRYNPLFLYGGVGLGKTHLLQAIGHAILKNNPDTKILYTSCEKFMNDFINVAVRSGRGKEFKDMYRNVDLLLIDDIQFIAGKKETQEEFFHTFNALHQENKQLVISSDRQPNAILALEDRLKTRFGWGMVADISSPDFETRVAILETKCKENNYFLPKDVVQHIATLIQSNVRELEGALTKIIAYHQFKHIVPTIETTAQLLSSFTTLPAQAVSKKIVTPKSIIEAVSSYFDIDIEILTGKSRERKFTLPRQIIMYLLREELKSSYPAIGKDIGDRDHTTAMHACNKIFKGLQNDHRLKQDVDLIRQRLYHT